MRAFLKKSCVRGSSKSLVLLSIVFCILLACPLRAEVCLGLFPMDDASRERADIILAELSDVPGVTFLERAEMDRIQQELLLNATLGDFTLSPSMMQNVGLFLLVGKDSLRAFDGRTGVRLLDEQTDAVKSQIQAVHKAIKKQQEFTEGKLKKISCMPLVPANLTQKQAKRAAELETALLRRLANRADVALLERRHLLLLLNEPNALENKLTESLFAGSIVIKSVAAPAATQGDIRFTVEFYTANGQTLLGSTTKELPATGDVNAFSDKFLSSIKLPEASATDKAGEASSFIEEAWFSIHTSSLKDAISSAAAATALDPAYEEELCCISALSAQRLLGSTSSGTYAILHAGVVNLKIALNIAERRHIFPKELEYAFRALHNYYPEDIKTRFGKMGDELPGLIRRGMDCFLESRKELREKIARPCENDIQRIVSLETRTYYFNELARYARVNSDCFYWDNYVLPELEIIINEFNELLPAIKELEARPEAERFNALRKDPDIRQRRLKRVSGFIVFMPDLGNLKINLLFNPQRLDGKWLESIRRTNELLMASRLLNFKALGRYGMFLLEIKMTSLDAHNRKIDISAQGKSMLLDMIDLLKKTEEGISPRWGSNTLLPLSPFDGSDFPEEKVIIQELISERFHVNDFWQGNIIFGYEHWNKEQVKMVYLKLLEWEKGVPPEALSNPFTPQRKTLEAKFGFTPPENIGRESQLDEIAFRNIRYPLEKQKIENWGYGCLLGVEKGNLLVVYNRTSSITTLASIDLQTGSVCNLQNYPGAIGNFRGGTGIGGIADDFYFALDGPQCHIFPKDLNKPRKIVAFDQYCPGYNIVKPVAVGNRLFVALYNMNANTQSNLIEYNIDTGETKVIASTIDRTVKWPMQDCKTAYPLLLKGVDLQNKRLLLQLTGQEYNSLSNHYAMRLWAYYYDKGDWEPISQILPVNSNSGCTMLQTEDGRAWLALDYGLGPINDQGIWQPEFVLGSDGRIGPKLPNFTNGFEKVPVDYSHLQLRPSPKYDDIDWRFIHFTFYAGNGRFFSENGMYDAKKHVFKRLPMAIRPLCADGRFLVAHTQGTNFNHLAIIELPEPTESALEDERPQQTF